MDYSPDGLKLTQSFEGCRLKAYLDSVGVPTIGYGHTHGVTMGMTCTQEQADAWLQEDAQGAVQAVNNLVTVPLTQQQFDALVDFTFNLGARRAPAFYLAPLVKLRQLPGRRRRI